MKRRIDGHTNDWDLKDSIFKKNLFWKNMLLNVINHSLYCFDALKLTLKYWSLGIMEHPKANICHWPLSSTGYDELIILYGKREQDIESEVVCETLSGFKSHAN